MDPLAVPFVSLAGDTSATPFACPLCGGRFTHGLQVCSSCPMSGGCELVRCPNCGYQFPRRSMLVELGRRLVHRLRGRPVKEGGAGGEDRVEPLARLLPGETGRVVRVASREGARLVRLSAMGVVPGALVTVAQRKPAVVIGIGETTLALDEAITAEIYVTRVPAGDTEGRER